MAIFPVRLCRIFRRSFFFLFPFGIRKMNIYTLRIFSRIESLHR